MNRKSLPLIMMLIAGAAACVITWVFNYTIVKKLIIILVVLFVFYLLGSLIKMILDYFEKQNEDNFLYNGDVIEKTTSGIALDGDETEDEDESESEDASLGGMNDAINKLLSKQQK